MRCDGHADDLCVRHGSADARVELAQATWTGLSAAALSAKTVQWQQQTAVMFSRLADHGQALRVSGLAFRETDERNAGAIDRL